MFSAKDIPSPSSLFSTYASMTASIMLARSMIDSLIPHPVREYAISVVSRFFKSRSSNLTLVIDENTGITRNEVYDAAVVYLSTKIDASIKRIKISKTPKDKNLTLKLDKNGKVLDFFDGVEIKWKLVHSNKENNSDDDDHPNIMRMSSSSSSTVRSCFEVSFPETHNKKILNCYIPYVIKEAKSIGRKERILKMHTLANHHSSKWNSVNMEHPASFETMAMEPELKRTIMEDLDRFVKRKEFYRRVGKAWKRGYLLYGPPGTGKSSLIAAMANYLKFDIYDLQLDKGMYDCELRRLLMSTENQSILVIEDIDCCLDLPDQPHETRLLPNIRGDLPTLTLSGLLNIIDGLWSSCGDERIIILTTNHKDRLDPALLRPGRMDFHIHMSYCTANAFKILASNYLGISENEHRLCEEIESLIENAQVTPAQIAEELMKSEDVDVVLEGVVKFLKRKRCSEREEGVEDGDENENFRIQKKKRLH